MLFYERVFSKSFNTINIIVYAISVGSIIAVGEAIPWKEISLLHLAYYLFQIELAGICGIIIAYLKYTKKDIH